MNLRNFSVMIFNNKTGELMNNIDCDALTFSVQNHPHFIKKLMEPTLEIHTHTDVDRYIKFDSGVLDIPDRLPRDPNLDREVLY